MSFNYSGDPSTSDLDAIRFLIGDTDETEHQLSDEEINWLVVIWAGKSSVYWTASMAATSIAAKYTREINISSDNESLGTSELQKKYLDLAVSLRALHESLLSGGTVDAGGIDSGEQPDLTVTPPSFGTGMHDDLAAGGQDYGDYNSTLSRLRPPEIFGTY